MVVPLNHPFHPRIFCYKYIPFWAPRAPLFMEKKKTYGLMVSTIHCKIGNGALAAGLNFEKQSETAKPEQTKQQSSKPRKNTF